MNTIQLLLFVVVALVLWGAAHAALRHWCQSHTIWDYQTALHYKNGQFVQTLTPGRHRLWGRGHTVVVYENRVMELVVQSQELITSDSATIKLSAVAHYRIGDARRFHETVADGHQALYTQVQLALREVLGSLDLDAVLAEKGGFSKPLLEAICKSGVPEAMGIELQRVVLRDLMLSGELKAAFASVLGARKEAQAKQERARGDAAALRTMANAARVLENNPELLRLRYLDTLKELGAGYGSSLFIGLPDDLAKAALVDSGKRQGSV